MVVGNMQGEPLLSVCVCVHTHVCVLREVPGLEDGQK